ncbi:SpoIID/LytB domain-containing protein [Demequina aurantiaca]|uniref:SpoIID/LytB domain-containing protein n=1 Tax=Demequina aurantiaca TaxID=676200 RepID=UPI003D338AD9
MRHPERASLRRSLIAAVLGLVFVATAATTSTAASSSFSDVPKSHQFYTQITWLADEGFTTGYADGTFRPKDSVTREAFAAFLYRMAGNPSVSLPSKSPFKDVAKSEQFYKQIVWAYQTGVSTGYSDGTYRPEDKISREAIAAFLYRSEGRPSVTVPGYSPFSDVSTSAQFFKEMIWLYTAGITTGYADGTFQPKGNTSREATAAFLYRVDGHPLNNPSLEIPSSFTVSGSGWGHGVGMSQYGAYGMALAGSSETDILTHYYAGTTVKTVAADSDIKVELFGSGSDSRDAVDVIVRSLGDDATDDGQWQMRFYNNGSSSPHTTWTGKNNETLKVTRSGNSVKVTRDGNVSATATDDVSLRWESTSSYQSSSAEDVYVDLYKAGTSSRATHGKYRHGEMTISVPSTSYPRLIVSNTLDLNTEYLYGIAEMPSSWSAEALQAQAIAARGYALNAIKSYGSTCDCNLYDDARSQNFSGWTKESEGTDAYYGKRWVAAVDATNSSAGANGKVLMYGSSIAKTYYFSSSGGQTERSEDVWVSQPGYLTSVADSWSLNSRNPNDSWTYILTQAKAKSIFGLSDVVSIKVTSRTAGGSDAAAKVVTATSSSGKTATISGPDTIRNKIVAGKSPWLWSFSPKY